MESLYKISPSVTTQKQQLETKKKKGEIKRGQNLKTFTTENDRILPLKNLKILEAPN